MSIKVEHLSKSYGTQKVLDDISFCVDRGEIVAFLGNNGAGKSTTMKIINGYLSYDSGNVSVCGLDVSTNQKETHRMIGYLPEHNPVYHEMYVREYLDFVAGVYGIDNRKARIDETIERTGLSKERKKTIGQLSKGYRQRVGLAAAIIHNPDVLILDEPTTGLDPNQILEVRDLIKDLGKDKAVMISTHIMQEVSAICDRVIILNNGKIVADKDERVIIHDIDEKRMTLDILFESPVSIDIIESLSEGLNCMPLSDGVIRINGEGDFRKKIFDYAVKSGNAILMMTPKVSTMEEAYRELTKQ